MSAESKPKLQKNKYPARAKENEAIRLKIAPTLEVRKMMDQAIRDYVQSPSSFAKHVEKNKNMD